MKGKTTLGMISVLLMVLSLATFASAQSWVPLTIERAEIDSTQIEPFSVNQLDIERNAEFELKLQLFAWNDSKDVEIRAYISGYEYNDVKPISARIGPFDFDANLTYVKRMKLTLPDDVNTDNYKLRIDISDRNGLQMVYNYDLKVDTARHAMKIKDVVMSPGSSVNAGTALLTTVRVENQGQKVERDIKVTMTIPELGISASQYIDEVKKDKQQESEELFLKLPKCAEPGVYNAKIDVWFNDGHDKTSASGKVTVLENEACKPEPAPAVVVQQSQNETSMPAPASNSTGKLRTALEIILLVLVALLVVVGLIIGFSRMKSEE